MKSKSKTAPTAYAKPYIDAAGAAQAPAYEAQQEAQKRVQPGLFKAFDFMGETMGGKYLDNNPYVDGMIEQGDREITDQVNGQFNSRFGSGYHTNALTRGLADNRTRLRFGNYNQERGYQNDAAGNMAQLAGAATQLPGVPADDYARRISGLFGNYNKTTQKQGAGGLLAGVAGAGLSGWATGGFRR